jgi:alkyl sulfatase BDS1-like metallo-beta-lactamase superfamily hydrolase
MTLELLFDFLGVKLNGPKAGNKKITLNMVFADTGEKAMLELVNGSLNHSLDKTAAAPVIGEFALSAAQRRFLRSHQGPRSWRALCAMSGSCSRAEVSVE